MADPVKIGKYDILERIGRGGMGFVYRAVDPLLKREVALKRMLKDLSGDEELRTRFMREAQSAGGLRHPNIVTIYDLGEDDEHTPYIAMEFLTGTDIEAIIKEKTHLPLLKKLDIIIQTCQGLGYAHSKGIIHRDIKPANIRLLDNGEVKIMDFGIAKIAASHFTRTGMIMGTPHYMAPEQIRGEKIDGRADIFSLGVVLFELVAFRKPFPGDNPTAVLFKIIHSEPERLQDVKFTPPEGLEEIAARSLAKKPDDRYQSCDEMIADLLQVFDKVKETEQIEPTFIIEKPYAAIAISRTPLPRKPTPIPRQGPALTPPPTAKKAETSSGKSVPGSKTEIPATAKTVKPETIKPLEPEPQIKPIPLAPSATGSKKMIVFALSGLVVFALLAFLLFGLIRKLAMSELTFPKLKTQAPHSVPSAPQPTKQPAPPQPQPQQPQAQQLPPPQPATQTPPAQTPPNIAPTQTELASTSKEQPPEVKQEQPAPVQAPGFIALNIQPWAEVKEVKDEKGNSAAIVCSVTPCKIQLPAGSYNISLYNSHYSNIVVHVDVRSNQITLVNQKMEGFDYAKAVESLGL